ncbi:MAG: mviN, partial [Alphaproteobacteria bacterium]|nr:mviN [Alphaproteobacteria bacterium]
MSFLRAAATVSGLTLASRVFGFVRDVLAAAIMGAGPVADAFFVALRLPNFFRSVAAEGAFSVSFVPLFSKTLHAEGQEVAQEFASQAMAMMLAVLIPFTVVAMFFMPEVLSVLAPGFRGSDGTGGERFAMAVTMTRITFGYLLFMSLASLVGGMLNAIDKFFAFATAPILFNLMQIILLGVVYKFPASFPTSGHAMAWGVLVSGLLQFMWLLWVLHKNRIRLRLMRPVLTDKIRRLFQLMGPGVLGASAVQINLLVDTIIASMLPVGAVSFLYYAVRLNQLPLGLIGTAVG